MNKLYELWEIYKDGKNGEIYEVVSCSVRDYIGHQVKVSAKTEGFESFKCLVKPDRYSDNAESSLVTLYGCLGTAKFKKVEHYEEITLADAVERLKDYRTVYYKFGTQYEELSRYTKFVDLFIDDFADLMNTKFYVKES